MRTNRGSLVVIIWALSFCLIAEQSQAVHPYRGSLHTQYPGSHGSQRVIQRFFKDWSRSSYLNGNPFLSAGFVRAKDVLNLRDQESLQCVNFYDRFFDQASLDLRIYFGYQDYPSKTPLLVSTRDPHIRFALMQFLTKPCPDPRPQNFFACGFNVKNQNTIVKQAVDHRGRVKTFWITLMNSAVGNPGSSYQMMSSSQIQKSRQITQAFLGALSVADVVLYAGHGRKGGGPDFYPPLLSELGEVMAAPSGIGDGKGSFLSVLESSVKKPKVIGVLACQSADYLESDLRVVAPQSALMLNREGGTYSQAGHSATHFFNDENVVLIGGINGFLGGFCPSSINKMMRYPGMDPDFVDMVLPQNFRGTRL